MDKIIKESIGKACPGLDDLTLDAATTAAMSVFFKDEEGYQVTTKMFRKRKVNGGWLYNFWRERINKWECDWHFVPEILI